MSPEEKERYLEEIRPEIERAVDAVFLEQFGRTYNDDDMKRARLPHGEQNGSSRPQDGLEHIRQEFPSLFGGDA